MGCKRWGAGIDPHHRRQYQRQIHCYYLTSLTDLYHFAETVRGHWAIENSQYWVLDVRFGEDAHRTRKNYLPVNLALIRRMALNVIRLNGLSKHNLRLRKMRAPLNDDYQFDLVLGKEPA
jgi:predicted transposase YbfD/YdcC